MTEYLNTHNASLLLSAANKSHYPQDDLPEIALAGVQTLESRALLIPF